MGLFAKQEEDLEKEITKFETKWRQTRARQDAKKLKAFKATVEAKSKAAARKIKAKVKALAKKEATKQKPGPKKRGHRPGPGRPPKTNIVDPRVKTDSPLI